MTTIELKKLVPGLFLFFLLPFFAFTQNPKQFYAGVSGGFVMPRNLYEHWVNEKKSQTADLIHLMNNGFLAGLKFGYAPKQLGGILALELEYYYEKATVDRITTGGFVAGADTIPAFSKPAADSYASFHSVFLNIIARYPKGVAHPYLGLSPGITFTTIAFNEPNLIGPFGFVEISNDTHFSFQLFFGSDFDITSFLSVGAGYKYFSVKPVMPWANGTYSNYKYNSHNFCLDLKFRF
jgi:opacity protein-like surface antigen